jgi:hypothetical protein
VRYFNFTQYLNVYNGLVVTMQQCNVLASHATAFLMPSGFGVCVSCNFSTVSSGCDPIPILYMFSGLAVFNRGMINIVLPEAVSCHELTCGLLAKWKSSVYSVWSNKLNRKPVGRRLRALGTRFSGDNCWIQFLLNRKGY